MFLQYNFIGPQTSIHSISLLQNKGPVDLTNEKCHLNNMIVPIHENPFLDGAI
jgi:hypothetical protein